jgi:hypothetical protein
MACENIIEDSVIQQHWFAYQPKEYLVLAPCHTTKAIPPQDHPDLDMPKIRVYCSKHAVNWEMEMLTVKLQWHIKQAESIQKEWFRLFEKIR